LAAATAGRFATLLVSEFTAQLHHARTCADDLSLQAQHPPSTN